MDNKKIKLQRLNIDLPKETIERMKEYSKCFLGCKRKNKGSAALFARKSIEQLIIREEHLDKMDNIKLANYNEIKNLNK